MFGVVSYSKGRHRLRYGRQAERCALQFRLGAKALYDRLRRRCPAAVHGLSLQNFSREVWGSGFPAAHRRRATTIGWWKYSGCFGHTL